MPRDASPHELSSSERTALWVQEQASQAYEQPRPPSPRTSIQTSSSYRTTSSSEESYLKSPVAVPVVSPYGVPPASMSQTQRPRYDARSRRASMPFPQSPPGSGYPVPLVVATPRRAGPEENKVSSDEPLPRPERYSSKALQTPRPSIRKQRRPSLIEQIISLGAPSQRRREDSGRRGET